MSKFMCGCAIGAALCCVAIVLNDGRAMAANPLDGLTPAQTSAVWHAIDEGEKQSRHCFSGGATPGGFVMIDVTFDGTSGKITAASLDGALHGTAVDDCVKKAFVGLSVATFDGPPRTSAFAYRPTDRP